MTKMFKSLILTAFLLGLSVPAMCFQDDSLDFLEPGSVKIGGALQLDGYYHKLSDNWSVTKVSGGLNNNYTFNESTPAVNKGASVFGESLFLNVGIRASENLKAEFEFEAIGDYADRYWLPVNLEHRMNLNGDTLNWNRGEITYSVDWMELRYFRNVGHYNWSDKGDLFDFYPAQMDTQRYLRVSGKSLPEGYELDMKGSAGSLEMIYGPEAEWDYKKGIYANYNFFLFGSNSNLLVRSHEIPYGDEGERMSSAELSTTLDFGFNTLILGVMYQPFRLDRGYDYVNYVQPGAGYLTTRYDLKTGIAVQNDAYGYSGKLTLGRMPFESEVMFKYSYLGLVAGNKQELDSLVTKRISRSLTGCFDFMYRKPLLGPMPLVSEGTLANPGPDLLEPRDMNSPFWVNWDNREANIMSLVFTFNPTPGSWFYRYEPNELAEWNLNPEETAPISGAVKYTLTRYFTGTDRLLYWNDIGQLIWEGPGLNEPWATDGYLGSFTLLAKIVTGKSLIIFDAGAGESLALNGFAYTTSTAQEKPVTGYFKAGISLERKPYHAKLSYSQDDWGPEAWHRSYGETWDRLYQFSITRTFTESISAGVDYVGGREVDKQYYAPELGDYDEFHLFLKYSFGPGIFLFSAQEEKQQEEPAHMVEADTTPPQVSLNIPRSEFSASLDQSLEFRPWAADYSGISSWRIDISTDPDSVRIVKTLSGLGQPPYSVNWDGTSDAGGGVVPPMKYFAVFSAKDEAGNLARTEALEIAVVQGGPKPGSNISVKNTDRSLTLMFSSALLFDVDKDSLKSGADETLDETIKILNTYKDNNILVEGHTDNTGSFFHNKSLSERRAKRVADFLVSKGLNREHIAIAGFGQTKPVASNETAQGRQANRRVEVIILKKQAQ